MRYFNYRNWGIMMTPNELRAYKRCENITRIQGIFRFGLYVLESRYFLRFLHTPKAKKNNNYFNHREGKVVTLMTGETGGDGLSFPSIIQIEVV